MNKVLFVIDTLATGGAEKSILEIASRFREYQPVVCHIYNDESLKAAYQEKGIEVISLGVPGRYNFRLAAQRLSHVIDRLKPAIVHSTLFRSDVICRWLKGSNKIPLINSLVNNSYHPSRYRNASAIMRMKLMFVQAIDAFTAPRADLFISNSEAITLSNAKALKIPLHKIRVIYRGRDYKDFGNIPPARVESIRASLGLKNEKIVVNTGRLLERKGQLDLIRAFANARFVDPQTILLIAGEGPHRSVLEHEIQLLNIGDRVRLLGNRNDVPELLSIADCFAFPSHYEGLPGALIEAMMAGVPIIASDIPENLECVDRDAATIYASGDLQGLTASLESVINSSRDLREQTARARLLALEKFDIGAIAMKYENLYSQLLNLK